MTQSTQQQPAVFELDEVTRCYGPHRALDRVTLRFLAGSTTAVIGSSGSGKSTLLRILLGLEWPDSGEVRFEGRLLTRAAVLAMRRRAGYVIQEGGLFPHLDVRSNLALLPRHLRWTESRVTARIGELLDMTRMPPEILGSFPAELSGGQRQRVALMRALMLDPPALLLDEPLGALDPVVRREIQDEFVKLFARIDKTVIVVTHDVAEAAHLASRLILLDGGKVVQDGTYRELREQPTSAFVTEFITAPRELPAAS